MTFRALLIVWIFLTFTAAGVFAFVVLSDRSTAKRALLPGNTTHGHYQIELACNACHTDFLGVKKDACANCHAAELKREKDTHPASKFNDPTNADRLAILDAQDCLTCHREHVPARTHAMGLSLPNDYCFHCHQDVAEQRPSHAGMLHDSCQTAGCHNYHDNRALYENFLYEHCNEPSILDSPVWGLQTHDTQMPAQRDHSNKPLQRDQADAPTDLLLAPIVDEWSSTAHANAGVNCRNCHDVISDDGRSTSWTNKPDHTACGSCHEREAESFLSGRHGMRLAQNMSPMTPEMARLPMHSDAAHRNLDCSACHQPHGYDTNFAAVEACMSCHNDKHTNSYLDSSHYELWKQELNGDAKAGAGVTCATCHMPRVAEGDEVYVDHNQNYNLRPNEKMIRSVCMKCHGLEFSLNSLADSLLVRRCFVGQPEVTIDSAQMAKRWFEEKERQKQQRTQRP